MKERPEMPIAVIAANREMRSVPIDFEWPLNKVWKGYLLPDELQLPRCEACDGTGYSIWARQLKSSFYRHQVGHNSEANWGNKLTQGDVDHLLEKGRLRTWDTENSCWVTLPLTAEFVNRCQDDRSLVGRNSYDHDGINTYILVKYRCELLGVDYMCDICEGKADIGTPEERQKVDDWESYDPPSGLGIQIWETTSEGSPISPVFAATDQGKEDLAAWMAEYGSKGWCSGWGRDDWLNVMKGVVFGVTVDGQQLES